MSEASIFVNSILIQIDHYLLTMIFFGLFIVAFESFEYKESINDIQHSKKNQNSKMLIFVVTVMIVKHGSKISI